MPPERSIISRRSFCAHSRRALICIGLAAIAAACADRLPEPHGGEAEISSGLHGDELWSVADVIIGEDDVAGKDPRLLSDPRVVLSPSPDTVILIDSHPPFMRLFDRSGNVLEATGDRGGGPMEFQTPSYAALRDGRLSIWDGRNGRLAEWTLDPLVPTQFADGPSREPITLQHACDGQLTALYSGQSQGRNRIGLQVHKAPSSWEDLSEVDRRPVPFSPSYPDFRAVGYQGYVVYHDWLSRYIKLISCADGTASDSVHVPGYPTDWGEPPRVRPRGVAALADQITVFYGRFDRRLADTTRIAVWEPGTESVSQTYVPGDWRLHDVSGSRIWLVDSRLGPRVLGIDTTAFRDLVGF